MSKMHYSFVIRHLKCDYLLFTWPVSSPLTIMIIIYQFYVCILQLRSCFENLWCFFVTPISNYRVCFLVFVIFYIYSIIQLNMKFIGILSIQSTRKTVNGCILKVTRFKSQNNWSILDWESSWKNSQNKKNHPVHIFSNIANSTYYV